MTNDTTTGTPAAAPKATRREWVGLSVLALPCLIYSMDLNVLNLAVPHLIADLAPSSADRVSRDPRPRIGDACTLDAVSVVVSALISAGLAIVATIVTATALRRAGSQSSSVSS